MNGLIGESRPRAPGQIADPMHRTSVGTLYVRTDRDPVDPEVSEYV